MFIEQYPAAVPTEGPNLAHTGSAAGETEGILAPCTATFFTTLKKDRADGSVLCRTLKSSYNFSAGILGVPTTWSRPGVVTCCPDALLEDSDTADMQTLRGCRQAASLNAFPCALTTLMQGLGDL